MTLPNLQTHVESSAWYQAFSLHERASSLHTSATSPVHSQPSSDDSERLAQRWQTQKPFDQKDTFLQRLAYDHLDESSFRRLIAESLADLSDRQPTAPDWLIDFQQAYTQPSSTNLSVDTFAIPDHQQALRPLLAVFAPLLSQGYARFQAGIKQLTQTTAEHPFDPQTIQQLLSLHLPQQLFQLAGRTFVLELNVARLQGRLGGDTPQERFNSFAEGLRHPEATLRFFQEYPVLARILTVHIECWVDASLEFLQHLSADWPALCDTFALSASDLLADVSIGGDTHRGRAVIVATLNSGARLVYKPRSLAVDRHFQALITWINDRANEDAPIQTHTAGQRLFRTIGILDRETHGWMEFIPMQPCINLAGVQRFYYRQGCYLALLYSIAATDFHAENLIATGEDPVLVDLETLFHAIPSYPTTSNADQLAGAHMESSVLGVGLLPRRLWSADPTKGLEFSGLGGTSGQQTPVPVPKLDGIGTDLMEVIHQHVELPSAQNRPTLNGVEVNTTDYTDAIVQGFTDIYHLLLTHQAALLAPDGPIQSFATDEIRIVLRPTMVYALLLRGSYHPNVLRNGLDRDRFFDKLWEQVERQPHLARVTALEHASLWRGDIPMFTTRPNSCDLWSDTGERIPQFFNESSLALVQHRLAALSLDDLRWQQWYIRASMTALSLVSDPTHTRTYQLTPSSPVATHERLISAARNLGDGLARLAWRGHDDAAWIGMVEADGQTAMLVQVGADLYYGTPGLALFFAQLGRITNETSYTDLARAALTTVRRQITRREFNANAIGAFEGWGGILYTLTHLGMLWAEPKLLAEAEALIPNLLPLIAQDSAFDYMIGSAGCITSLLTLYRCTHSAQALNAAIQCGEHLIAAAIPQPQGLGWSSPISATQPLTGFSHGAAGIAWALTELAACSGQTRFRDTAEAALAYERSQFSAEAGNWRDHRAVFANIQPHFNHFWCHGASGIGLSRLKLLADNDESHLRQEIEAAVTATLRGGFGATHCLCHGDLGNLELLMQVGHARNDHNLLTQTYQIAACMLDSAESHGWLCGVPLNVETPGLMTGLAGIGYGLLRLAEPTHVPSVLTLDPPYPHERIAGANV